MRALIAIFIFSGYIFLLSSTLLAAPFIVETSKDGVQRAEINVDTYTYTPNHIVVVVNRPVELTLKSATWIVPHNFVIKEPEAGIDISKDVPAGKTITISFTPTKEGRFKILCDKKLLFFKSHQEKGMEGVLEVKGSD
ncbi:MAG TPA: cupredoxin domain-containing protein [Candidatus Brocadiales bacterium]|nr:cupredoxin domain-containing protein [Candidatus Brocadiales bacterium]